MKEPSVSIIVLNWNGGRDTAECLLSLSKMTYRNYKVIVVDNASSDDSIAVIEEAIACLPTDVDRDHFHKATLKESDRVPPTILLQAKYTLLISAENGGFAAGNNHGIRAAIADSSCDFVWLLNNDVEVDSNALSALVHRASVGTICAVGSVLVFYDTRTTVQCIGGVQFDIRRASGVQIGQGCCWSAGVKFDEPKLISYIAGASMLLRAETIRIGGLMDERYFLYFEEIDWAHQLAGLGDLAVATDSIVFHKEGASIGTASRGKRSNTSYYYLSRNLILFYAKRYPHLTAIALFRNVREAIRAFDIREPNAFKTILVATVHGLLGRNGKRA